MKNTALYYYLVEMMKASKSECEGELDKMKSINSKEAKWT